MQIRKPFSPSLCFSKSRKGRCFPHNVSGKAVKVAPFVVAGCVLSACAQSQDFTQYSQSVNPPHVGVGPGDIHALSSGNLVW